MKRVAIVIVVAVVALGACMPTSNTSTPSVPQTARMDDSSIGEIEAELAGWAEGRWSNYTVGYDADDKAVIVQIAVDPLANDTALSSYEKIVVDLWKSHAHDQTLAIRMFKAGNQVRSTVKRPGS